MVKNSFERIKLAFYCGQPDGRMFFELTRDGRPLRKRRYLFSECFGVMALSEYYRATNDEKALERAKDTYNLVIRLHKHPDSSTPPKIFPQTRVIKSLAMQFMLICISQEIRKVDSNPLYEEVINDWYTKFLTIS
ncbi:MAG: hypothetical protein QXZ66_07860 [Thermoproteota archaeon]